MYTYKATQTLGEIVTELPQAARLFNQLRIDYCCGGDRTFAQALTETDLDPEKVASQLEALAAVQAASDEQDPKSLASGDLADQIEARHHSFMRENLPLISELLDAVMHAHGVNHPELFQLHKAYSSLRGDIEQHLIKEEILLFPYYHSAAGSLDQAAKEKIQAVIAELRSEHEAAGGLLRQMRQVTSDYTLPSDACSTYERLFKKLTALEEDLFQHIHLENNILFNKEAYE